MAACREATPSSSPSSTAWPAPCPTPAASLEELTARQVNLSLGGSVHDPTDPVGRLLFNVLAMVAEFESDLIGCAPGGHEGRQGQGPAARQAAS